MLIKILPLFFVVAINYPLCASESAGATKRVELSAPSLAAMATATDRFRADGNKINGYRSMIFEHGDGIEVIFVPELVGSSNMVGFEKSNRQEIHYYLDLSGVVIQKVLLGQ